MTLFHKTCFSKRQLATYLLLWSSEVAARPAPQEEPPIITPEITPIVTTATGEGGSTVVQTFTPTSITISGLVPPITAATTITVTQSAGDGLETVAAAIVAGAGLVAGGAALAAWMFKPIPGQPPAPTSPPPYSTSTQDNEPEPTPEQPQQPSEPEDEPAACPFPSGGTGVSWHKVDNQPQWTAGLPPDKNSGIPAKCTSTGDNSQLLRGTEPGYIKALAEVFCKSDLGKDQSKTLGQPDLPDDSRWKNEKLDSVRVKFDFRFRTQHDGCAQNCVDSFSKILSTCQYNSHVMFGSGSLEQDCGDYDLIVDADIETKLACTPPEGDVFSKYMYRDAALGAIDNFCTAWDGHVLKAKDEGSFIKETSFTVTYSDNCAGSGSYSIKKDLCVQYLRETVDNCDTSSTAYKHGGTTTDMDNCGSFEFHPTANDVFSCFPENLNRNYIGGGEHVAVSVEMAEDAVGQFCDRSGDGQSYTLDPAKVREPNSFIQDACKQEGMAACSYFYSNDGKRVTDDGLGDISIRMEAAYQDFGDPAQFGCAPREVYEIHGDRCKQSLRKVMGIEPKGQCLGSDPGKLDLGSFHESGEKGCVLWNFWATKTH